MRAAVTPRPRGGNASRADAPRRCALPARPIETEGILRRVLATYAESTLHGRRPVLFAVADCAYNLTAGRRLGYPAATVVYFLTAVSGAACSAEICISVQLIGCLRYLYPRGPLPFP